jgi:NitT/TauT family transport system substrate-binding protein
MTLMWRAGAVAAMVLAPFSAAQAQTKVRIMYTAVAPYASSFIAKDQGFFAKRGIDAELILAANGSVIIAGVVSGNVEVGTPTPTVFIQALESGLDQIAIAATNVLPDASRSGVLARTDTNIKTAQDLAGKKVGVPGLNGLLDVMFRKWLADSGVDTKRVSYLETSFPQMSDLLKAGQVDAVVAVDPFYSRILDQKTGYLIDDYTRNVPAGTIASVYSATSKWANANPAVVKAFQESLVEGIAFSKTNVDATRDSIARYTKLPPGVVASLPVPNLSAKIGPQDLKFWIDTMTERGMLNTVPDANKAVAKWMAGE